MTLKMRVLTKIPALFNAAPGFLVERVGRVYTVTMDWLNIGLVDNISDPTVNFIIVVDEDGLYQRIALDAFQASVAGGVQVIEASGTHAVADTAAVVIVNPSVAGAVTLNMPAAAAKIGAVTIVDWKQNAGTNNITIAPNGSEKFNGLSSPANWTLATDGAAATLSPYPGEGYAVR